MEVIFKTDTGKLRDHNEDNGAVLVKKEAVLAIIADGMGGYQAGEEASRIAVERLEEAWSKHDPSNDLEDEKWLEETVLYTNKAIFDYAESHPECKGMGTTLVAALCRSSYLTIANVGDSRGYLILDSKRIEQITEDHSLVNELVKAGQLSEEDAMYHPRKNVITRALGTDAVTKVDVERITWNENMNLLLCSDGLSNLVNRQELLKVINSPQPIENKAEELIRLANEKGGQDNISVAIVHNLGGDAS